MVTQKIKTMNNFISFVKQCGFKISGSYVDNATRLEIECPVGHKFLKSPHNFKNHPQCSICNGKDRKTSETKFFEVMQSLGYSTDDVYVINTTKMNMTCSQGHNFISTPNRIKTGYTCKYCSTSIKRYDPSSIGVFYLVRWVYKNKSFLKFGITNRTAQERLYEQGRHTLFRPVILEERVYNNGHIPLELETIIKANMNVGVVDKSLFGQGFTETVTDSTENLKYIEELLKAW